MPAVGKPIKIIFSGPVARSSVLTNSDGKTNGTQNVFVVDGTNRQVSGRFSFENSASTVLLFTPGTWVGQVFTPGPWLPNSDYGIAVSRGVISPIGAPMRDPFVMVFSTSATAPSVAAAGGTSNAITTSIPGFPPGELWAGGSGSGGGGKTPKKGPVPGAFNTLAQSLTAGRFFHTSTILPSGEILVAGGGINNNGGAFGTAIGDAEVFDPSSDTFRAAGVSGAVMGHSATLLDNGEVIIIGGVNLEAPNITTRAEKWRADPANQVPAGVWNQSGNMEVGRFAHSASSTGGNQIFLVGGMTRLAASVGGSGAGGTPAIEVFRGGQDFRKAIEKLRIQRGWHETDLYDDITGTHVLITGGSDTGPTLVETEIYTLTAETSNPNNFGQVKDGPNMTVRRGLHRTSRLDRDVVAGIIVIGGGIVGSQDPQFGGISYTNTASIEAFDPRDNTTRFFTNASLINARHAHTQTLLSNGKILCCGGAGAVQPPLDAGQFHMTSTCNPQPANHQDAILFDPNYTKLNNQRDQLIPLATAALVPTPTQPPGGTGGSVSEKLSASRGFHTATNLGTVVIILAGETGCQVPDKTGDRYTVP